MAIPRTKFNLSTSEIIGGARMKDPVMTDITSNIVPVSNIFNLKESQFKDKEFRKHVRGRKAVLNLLEQLRIEGEYIPDFRTESVKHLLTIQQTNDLDSGNSCSLLKNDDELIYGQVMRDGKLKEVCKCYNVDCRLFSTCRPGVNKTDVLAQQAELKNLLAEQSKGLLKQDFDENIFYRDSSNKANDLQKSHRANVEERKTSHAVSQEVFEFAFDLTEFNKSKGSSKTADDEQQRAKLIKGHPEEKMLVTAGPGTGKTHSLIEKIKYMAENFEVEPSEEMLVLCFTRTAVREIKERYYDFITSHDAPDNLSYLNIRTFDSFATQLLIHEGIETDGKSYDERIELAIETIEEEPQILENLQHLFVDEIQDLVGARARLVRTMIQHAPGGFTLLGDPFQGIYDYQVKDSDISSEEFIAWLQSNFSDELVTVSMSENKRQKKKLSNFSATARTLLDNKEMEEFFNLVKKIPNAGKIQKLTFNPDEKTAILCRTNGEALEVSSHLTKMNIAHQVKTQNTFKKLPVWLDKILNENQITLATLEKLNEDAPFFEHEELVYVFNLLHSLANDYPYVINTRDLRERLIKGFDLPDELYENHDSRVLVTTIHQSKGREFDKVYFMDRSEANLESNDEWQEAKVYYVALTRAKRELFTVNNINTKRTFLLKTRIGRWVKIESTPKWKVRLVEVGAEKDVAEESFVSPGLVGDTTENQLYIRSEIQIGDEVVLNLDGDTYAIYHNDRKIGTMSAGFTFELKQALRERYGRNMRYMPSSIDEVYVDWIYTVLRKPETLGLDVEDSYGATGVWLAVQVAGMGKINWSISRNGGEKS
jgi:DNA helicase II / ATP-dependent DNA helicase PcrA